MKKVDLITGFLGSGKTTFLKNYVKYLVSKGEKVGIIENDYGAISVDLMLLHEELGDLCQIGMIVAGDMDCYRRRFKTKLISMGMMGVDRIIVEPSGIYDVDEFFDILHEEPVEGKYEVGNVIAVVDSVMETEMSEDSKYILSTQTADAGIVVFSKTDLLQGELRKSLNQTIIFLNNILEENKCNRRYNLISATEGPVYINEKKDIIAGDRALFGEAEYKLISECGYKTESYLKKHISDNNKYRSLFFYNLKIKKESIEKMTGELFEASHTGHIYRIKGYLKIDNNWYELNITPQKSEINIQKEGQEVITVIGEDMQEKTIVDIIGRYSESDDFIHGKTSHLSH
jgi:G3E family GTPase